LVAKYRRKILLEPVPKTFTQSCFDLVESYDYTFHEI